MKKRISNVVWDSVSQIPSYSMDHDYSVGIEASYISLGSDRVGGCARYVFYKYDHLNIFRQCSNIIKYIYHDEPSVQDRGECTLFI
jgi:hypothetical protein